MMMFQSLTLKRRKFIEIKKKERFTHELSARKTSNSEAASGRFFNAITMGRTIVMAIAAKQACD